MKTAKKFDCVRMKDNIQADLLKQWRGVAPEDIRQEIERHLAASDSDVAKWWRSMEPTATKRQRPR
jgi:hypothetical protein